MSRVITLVAVAVAVSWNAASAGFVVAPHAYANSVGTIGVGTLLQAEPRTFQVVYAASEFAGVPLGSEITAVAFRLEAGQATWPPSDRHYDHYDVELSRSLNAPGMLSTTFANNIGPDAVMVRSGPLDVAAGSIAGGPGLNPFDFVLAFTTPYVYEGGDLLLSLTHTGNGSDLEFVDSVADDAIGESIAAVGYQQPDTGGFNIDSYPIAQFTYGQPVPEPSSVALLGTAIAACGFARRRRASEAADAG